MIHIYKNGKGSTFEASGKASEVIDDLIVAIDAVMTYVVIEDRRDSFLDELPHAVRSFQAKRTSVDLTTLRNMVRGNDD